MELFASDAPQYKVASGMNVASLSTVFLTLLLLGLWMTRDNRRRDMTQTLANEALNGLSSSGNAGSGQQTSTFSLEHIGRRFEDT